MTEPAGARHFDLESGLRALLVGFLVEDRATIDASTVVKRAYRSRHGAFILSCSAPEGEGATFVVSPAGDVTYLGNALTLIDAGDYDGDGSAELVFAYAREDLDGYVLFDGAFTHHQAFGWQYH